MIGVKSKQGIPTRTWGWITSFLWRKASKSVSEDLEEGIRYLGLEVRDVRSCRSSVELRGIEPARVRVSPEGPWKPREAFRKIFLSGGESRKVFFVEQRQQ